MNFIYRLPPERDEEELLEPLDLLELLELLELLLDGV